MIWILPTSIIGPESSLNDGNPKQWWTNLLKSQSFTFILQCMNKKKLHSTEVNYIYLLYLSISQHIGILLSYSRYIAYLEASGLGCFLVNFMDFCDIQIIYRVSHRPVLLDKGTVIYKCMAKGIAQANSRHGGRSITKNMWSQREHTTKGGKARIIKYSQRNT